MAMAKRMLAVLLAMVLVCGGLAIGASAAISLGDWEAVCALADAKRCDIDFVAPKTTEDGEEQEITFVSTRMNLTYSILEVLLELEIDAKPLDVPAHWFGIKALLPGALDRINAEGWFPNGNGYARSLSKNLFIGFATRGELVAKLHNNTLATHIDNVARQNDTLLLDLIQKHFTAEAITFAEKCSSDHEEFYLLNLEYGEFFDSLDEKETEYAEARFMELGGKTIIDYFTSVDSFRQLGSQEFAVILRKYRKILDALREEIDAFDPDPEPDQKPDPKPDPDPDPEPDPPTPREEFVEKLKGTRLFAWMTNSRFMVFVVYYIFFGWFWNWLF